MNTFKQFLAKEDGAVTVDWVVLTAAIVGLAVLIAARWKKARWGWLICWQLTCPTGHSADFQSSSRIYAVTGQNARFRQRFDRSRHRCCYDNTGCY